MQGASKALAQSPPAPRARAELTHIRPFPLAFRWRTDLTHHRHHALIQLRFSGTNHVHHVPAKDREHVAPDKPSSTSQLTTPVAKWTVALVGRATARCAAALLDKLIAGPFPHRGRDVGSGRAFSVGEARAGVALDGHVAPFQWACGRKFLARSDKTRGAGPGEGCCLGQFRSTEPCHATRSPHRRPFHRVFHVRRHARGRRRARARRRAKDLRLGGDVLPELYDPKE